MSAISRPDFGLPPEEAEARRRAGLAKTRGNRNQLAQRFIGDVHAFWEETGEATLRRAAFHEPMRFVAMVAGTLPQRIEHVADTAGMTDERYAELLNAVHAAIEAKRSQGAPPPLRLEGDAAETGGGGPPAVAMRGEVEGPIPAAPLPRPAEVGIPAAEGGATPVEPILQTTYSVVSDEDEVDPASLF